MTQIANPIYDVVFKYLMKDKKVAKLLLSAITDREIVDLDFRPTEYELPIGESLMVVRMDFSARVRDENGDEQLIIIELQKAKLATDIMRFRRYLGEQYTNKNNTYTAIKNGKPHQQALPILSVYFLGHKLDHCKAPVIRVKRQCLDAATEEELAQKEEFIESLTHDSYIIQIRYLNDKRRTELEKLLVIFDQSNKSADEHFLTINDEEIPKRYRPLVRRLQQALADVKVKQTMTAEDEIVEELKTYQRIIAQKQDALEEKDKALEEKDRALEEKDRALEESSKTLEENKKVIKRAVLQMHQTGMNEERIAIALSLSLEEVKESLRNVD